MPSTEETRVVVLDNQQVDELILKPRTKRPFGNIYLAKITRVEPSLQAAFVDYGGNGGFLASTKFIPIITKYRLATAKRCWPNMPKKSATKPPRKTIKPKKMKAAMTARLRRKWKISAATRMEEFENARALHRKYKIQEIIKRRQIILVQVMKKSAAIRARH